MTRALVFLLSPQWLAPARMPEALATAGFEVATLSHVGSFLSRAHHARQHCLMVPGSNWRPALADAVRRTRPDLVIPGCEPAVIALQEAACDTRSAAQGGPSPDIQAVARRSLGNPAYFRATLSKHRAAALAREAGIAVPAQVPVETIAEARAFADRHGYPVVLKAEFGVGGNNVKICADRAQLEAGLQALVENSGAGRPQHIVAQEYIRGTPGIQSAVAVSGEVLERLSALKRECGPTPTGPGSVMEIVEHPDMDAAVGALMQRFGFTGFANADFIVDAAGRAWFLEFNPRPTNLCHLGALAGRDLARALRCRLSGVPGERPATSRGATTIALFPQELIRDCNSPWLGIAHSDIPADPALHAALLAHARDCNPAIPVNYGVPSP